MTFHHQRPGSLALADDRPLPPLAEPQSVAIPFLRNERLRPRFRSRDDSPADARALGPRRLCRSVIMYLHPVFFTYERLEEIACRISPARAPRDVVGYYGRGRAFDCLGTCLPGVAMARLEA